VIKPSSGASYGTTTSSTTSTPRVSCRRRPPRATPASPDEKSSSIPTAAGRARPRAFSGKDPSKVDRSACYMGRYIARTSSPRAWRPAPKWQLAYAIGVAKPSASPSATEGTALIPRIRSRSCEGAFSAHARGIIRIGLSSVHLQADGPAWALRTHPRQERRVFIGEGRQGLTPWRKRRGLSRRRTPKNEKIDANAQSPTGNRTRA